MSINHVVNQLLGEMPVLPHRSGRVHLLDPHAREWPKARIAHSKDVVDRVLSSGLSVSKMGVPETTVYRWRKNAGIPNTGERPSIDYPMAFRLAVAAAPGTLRSVAEKYGVPLVTVHRWRKQYS
jgi:transposase-like protein